MTKHGLEFQREAGRIALASGLPRKRVSAPTSTRSRPTATIIWAWRRTGSTSLSSSTCKPYRWLGGQRPDEEGSGDPCTRHGRSATRGRHSYLGGISPLTFEAKVA